MPYLGAGCNRFAGMWKKKSRESPGIPPVNPWVPRPTEKAGRNAETSGPRELTVPWAVVQERPAGLARLGRMAFWVAAGAVGVLAAVGFRQVMAPHPESGPTGAPAPGPSVSAYPEDAARAVAVRAARAYLTWDEGRPAERARELSGVLATGVDPQLGWDGRGVQAVGAVVPGPVTAGPGGRARVRVEAQVSSGSAPARWVALDVPVVVGGGGRLMVSGAPALLGVPGAPGSVPEATSRPADPEFSTLTRSAVADFFAAWATGGGGQVAAPGTVLPALPAGVELRAVQSWEAAPGSGADRSGLVRVAWAIGGAEVTQSYRVQLTRVESARAGRWQVSAISGDDLT